MNGLHFHMYSYNMKYKLNVLIIDKYLRIALLLYLYTFNTLGPELNALHLFVVQMLMNVWSHTIYNMTISHHWFRWWLGTEQATLPLSIMTPFTDANMRLRILSLPWWPSVMTHMCVNRLQCVYSRYLAVIFSEVLTPGAPLLTYSNWDLGKDK